MLSSVIWSGARHQRFVAFIVVAFVFLLFVKLGLLVPVYTGLLAFGLVTHFSETIVDERIRSIRSKWIATTLVTVLVVVVLVGAGAGIHMLLKTTTDVHDLMLRMSDILNSARSWLPESIRQSIPQQNDLLTKISEWLRTHAADIGTFGLGALKGIGLALLGVLLGALIAVSETTHHQLHGPVSTRLLQQLASLKDAFWRVAIAQVKISALNTTLTATYLAIVLPLFGVQLPLIKTLIAVTFIAGLLPVVGNLISNTVITVISLSHSFGVAVAALGFLIVVHKLEYFINARIVGTQINAKAWEILLSMLIMERCFGLIGVVAAPVFYAWLKQEWQRWDQVQHEKTHLNQT
ncbi:AI-2E family transporter [Agitococcus lubricus]|uniref:Putative PurR-regulated permease PerM n=1 Tax=Agitococcus lubricus TaxID=1077255 RepID=A0A2T5IZW2_9GAMM|nr:AI-2E family transporter [Agitococcus lubricus]PTQ89610.1 putative PurR-regulated permease PerM [Agitococcus lubricus]